MSNSSGSEKTEKYEFFGKQGIDNSKRSPSVEVATTPSSDSKDTSAGLCCPKCGATKIAKSRAQSLDSLLMRFIPQRPYRCLHCYHRFWNKEKFTADKRRVISWLLLLAIIVLLVILKLQSLPDATQDTQAVVGIGPVYSSSSKASSPEASNQIAHESALNTTPVSSLVPTLNDRTTIKANRELMRNIEFSVPRADQQRPALSNTQIKQRLAAAKLRADTAEQYNRQKLPELNAAIKAKPAEEQSLLRIDINRRVEQWRSAWQDGDSERYLGFYSENFVPAQLLTPRQWRLQRKARVVPQKNIKLSLSNFNVVFSEQNKRATIQFKQHYQSGNYTDDSKKELVLIMSSNQWFIIAERQVRSKQASI